jgi:hypothetical protein
MPHHDGFTLHLRYGLILLELDGDLLLHDEDQALLSRSSVLSLENTHSVPPRVPRASPGPRFESPMPWTVISVQSRSPTGVHPACEAQRRWQLVELWAASGAMGSEWHEAAPAGGELASCRRARGWLIIR